MMLRKKSMSSLFVGLNSNKSSQDSDPTRSPTSHLDHMIFSNLSNPFAMSPRSPKVDSPRKSWESDRVGLGLVDSLVGSRSIVFGSKMRSCKVPYCHESTTDRMQTMSCPSDIDFVHRALRSNSLKVGSPPVVRDVSLPLFMGSLSASDIETSEDYTRITTHGPNPKTTHIFGDCVLESRSSEFLDLGLKVGDGKASPWVVKCPEEDPFHSFESGNFLSSCYFCKKKLGAGDDIYIFRGEKAFCSFACREHEILIDEEMKDGSMASRTSSSSTSIAEEISFME